MARRPPARWGGCCSLRRCWSQFSPPSPCACTAPDSDLRKGPLMTTTTTPNRPNTHPMVVGHRVFRREFRLLPGLILAVRIGDTARARVLAEHCADVTNGLHRHHTSEDEVLWPRLLDRTPLHAQLVHRMEAQHEQL